MFLSFKRSGEPTQFRFMPGCLALSTVASIVLRCEPCGRRGALRLLSVGSCAEGVQECRADYVKEDLMYVSIGTILAILLIIVLIVWIL
jgi:hypothetical protein